MKSLNDFKCGRIIHTVDIKKEKNSQFVDEITIKASPPMFEMIQIQTCQDTFMTFHYIDKSVREPKSHDTCTDKYFRVP